MFGSPLFAEMNTEEGEKKNMKNGDAKCSDGSEDETHQSDGSDDDDDDDDDDKEEEETGMDVDEEMRANVKTALGDAAADSDGEVCFQYWLLLLLLLLQILLSVIDKDSKRQY